MAAPEDVRAFAVFAAVFALIAVDAQYVVAASSKWGTHLARREPATAATFVTQALSLGFCERARPARCGPNLRRSGPLR